MHANKLSSLPQQMLWELQHAPESCISTWDEEFTSRTHKAHDLTCWSARCGKRGSNLTTKKCLNSMEWRNVRNTLLLPSIRPRALNVKYPLSGRGGWTNSTNGVELVHPFSLLDGC